MTASEKQSAGMHDGETNYAATPDSVGISAEESKPRPAEYGGRRAGLDPVRYGDWEKNGRCIDF